MDRLTGPGKVERLSVLCGCVFGMKTRTGQAFRHFEFPVWASATINAHCQMYLRLYWAGLYQVSIISWFCGIESPSLFERGGAVFWVMVMVMDMDSVSVKGSNLLAWGR